MPYEVIILPDAERSLNKLQSKMRARIVAAIEKLDQNPRPKGCVKLTGLDDVYRVRVGVYRIVYKIKDGLLQVLVVAVGHRGSVYD